MQYGSIEAKVKSAPVGGIVTAFIWMAPGGDEIDYEWVGTEAQSAYYYHGILDYSTEGSQIVSDDSSAFHIYRIDWSADSMVWSIDGQAIRTVTKDSTLKNGTYHYPTEASNVQFGVWDASENPSTAAWAHGPVNWSIEGPSISSFIEYITVSC
jgi:beta-glucanase (GH16 family)